VSGLDQTVRSLTDKVVMFHLDAPSSPAGATHAQAIDREIGSTIKPKRNSDRRKARLSEDSMKRVFLLIVVPAMLVAMGFAQTPAASANTDQVNIKGCLGGTEGNYTLAEDSTGKVFRIIASSADLKGFGGQEVKLTGRKASAGENSLAVTGVNMLSEHCTAAAAAPAAAASAPADNASTPPAAAAPSATAPEATVVSTPAETVSTTPVAAPAAALATTGSTPAETVSAPSDSAIAAPVAATAPAIAPVVAADATVSAPAQTASAPAAATPVHKASPSARPRKPAATPSAAAIEAAPAEPVVSTPAAHDVVPTAVDNQSADNANSPAKPVAVAPKTSTTRSAGMLISIVVVLLIGAGVPLYNRWRRRKLADETRGQNLSFTNEAKSDPFTSDTTGGRKAA